MIKHENLCLCNEYSRKTLYLSGNWEHCISKLKFSPFIRCILSQEGAAVSPTSHVLSPLTRLFSVQYGRLFLWNMHDCELNFCSLQEWRSHMWPVNSRQEEPLSLELYNKALQRHPIPCQKKESVFQLFLGTAKIYIRNLSWTWRHTTKIRAPAYS